MLIDQLQDADLADESVVEKLLANARLRKQVSKKFLQDLEETLRDHGLSRFKAPTESTWWSTFWPYSEPGELGVEHYGVANEDGSHATVIKRYLARENRGSEEVTALQNVLRSLRRGDNHFLKVFAASHTPDTLAADKDAEVMIMLEPFSGSLRHYLGAHRVSLPKRLALFHSLIYSVYHLNLERTPHNSVITPDNVLILGDFGDIATTSAVLCPSILNTDLQVCSTQQAFHSWVTDGPLPDGVVARDELVIEDLKQLGELLEWIVQATPRSFREEKNPFLAFARELQLGSYASLDGPFGAILAFEVVVSDGVMRQTEIDTYAERIFGSHAPKGTISSATAWDEVTLSTGDEMRPARRLAQLARRAIEQGSSVAEDLMNKL